MSSSSTTQNQPVESGLTPHESAETGSGRGNKKEGKVGGGTMLTNEGFDLVKRVYGIEEEVGARILDPTETESSPREGYVVIYEWQIRNGPEFPICPLSKEILKQYRISIS